MIMEDTRAVADAGSSLTEVPGTPNSAARPAVLHFIASIDGGGAEAMLRSLVTRTDHQRWRVIVVAVDARSWPGATAFLKEHCDAFYDLESPKFLNRQTTSGLCRILRAEKPDLVQTWMHHADLVGGVIAKLMGVRRVIWSIHCREIHRSPGDSELKSSLLKGALAIASRIVPDTIVSCSQAAIEDHRKRGYPTKRMRWIPNGIDILRFQPNAKARNLPIIEHVHFLPFRPDPESLYPAMDVFTLTSRTEACPMTVLEAMACGVPCVTSDTGDCGLLLDGRGELVAPGDNHGFQKAWTRMLKLSRGSDDTLAKCLRQRVIDHFSIPRAAAAYQDLYAELVPSPQS